MGPRPLVTYWYSDSVHTDKVIFHIRVYRDPIHVYLWRLVVAMVVIGSRIMLSLYWVIWPINAALLYDERRCVPAFSCSVQCLVTLSYRIYSDITFMYTVDHIIAVLSLSHVHVGGGSCEIQMCVDVWGCKDAHSHTREISRLLDLIDRYLIPVTPFLRIGLLQYPKPCPLLSLLYPP